MRAKKKIVIVAITAMLTIVAVSVGFRIYLGMNADKRAALAESALSNGPWSRQAVWDADDGQAYLLSQKTDNEKICAVTAYFYINKAWCQFQVNLTYGNMLVFTDESGADKFTGEFEIKEDRVFAVKNLKAIEENASIPSNTTYTFSESTNYDEDISKLPFDFTA